jgi:hypothetical protein
LHIRISGVAFLFMNISRVKLSPNVLNYLLNTLSKKKTYGRVLKDKIENLLSVRRSEYREVNSKILHKNFDCISSNQDTVDFDKTSKIAESVLVAYIIDITRTRSNLYLNIYNSIGKLMLTASAGNLVDLSVMKRKSASLFIINAIFKLIPKQKYLKGKPIALNIKNKRIPLKFLRKLRKKNIVKCITVFNKKPFNGCRGKKVRAV